MIYCYFSVRSLFKWVYIRVKWRSNNCWTSSWDSTFTDLFYLNTSIFLNLFICSKLWFCLFTHTVEERYLLLLLWLYNWQWVCGAALTHDLKITWCGKIFVLYASTLEAEEEEDYDMGKKTKEMLLRTGIRFGEKNSGRHVWTACSTYKVPLDPYWNLEPRSQRPSAFDLYVGCRRCLYMYI